MKLTTFVLLFVAFSLLFISCSKNKGEVLAEKYCAKSKNAKTMLEVKLLTAEMKAEVLTELKTKEEMDAFKRKIQECSEESRLKTAKEIGRQEAEAFCEKFKNAKTKDEFIECQKEFVDEKGVFFDSEAEKSAWQIAVITCMDEIKHKKGW